MTENKKLNRIKVVLVEKDLTNKWLGQQLGKSEFTVSRWITNKQQPSVEQLFQIANLLKVEVKDLLVSQDQISSDMIQSSQKSEI
jgi:DNA-binding XRE family transcriptional regulator